MWLTEIVMLLVLQRGHGQVIPWVLRTLRVHVPDQFSFKWPTNAGAFLIFIVTSNEHDYGLAWHTLHAWMTDVVPPVWEIWTHPQYICCMVSQTTRHPPTDVDLSASVATLCQLRCCMTKRDPFPFVKWNKKPARPPGFSFIVFLKAHFNYRVFAGISQKLFVHVIQVIFFVIWLLINFVY